MPLPREVVIARPEALHYIDYTVLFRYPPGRLFFMSRYSTFRLILLASFIPGSIFWPYFAGTAALAIGFLVGYPSEDLIDRQPDWLIRSGPLLFAFAMAVFGADHLTTARFVAMIVPSWIPWHLFWAYFVGFALLAAALSLASNVRASWAAAMLSLMIFIFVLTIHVPNWLAAPHDTVKFTILLRDLSLSAGLLAFASAHINSGLFRAQISVLAAKATSRIVLALATFVFGVDHFLHPAFAPGIPQENRATFVTMPTWIPAHEMWAYLTGAIFVSCAVAMISPKFSRMAAKMLGSTVIVLIALVYLPLTIAKASDIANGLNYLAIHFALAGSAFLLADALSPRQHEALAGVQVPSIEDASEPLSLTGT